MSTLRGASAEAVAALADELGTSVSGTSAARVADDLFSVAAALRSEGALRRFATDASIPAEAKTGLVTEVFGGKVDDATLSLLTSAVGRRWTAGRDLADSLERLGVVALVKSAGKDGVRLADELFAFAQAVKDNPDLRDALSDPARTTADKRALLEGLLGGKALPATVTLAGQSLDGSHRTVGAALAEYQKIVSEVQGENVATVRVARPLPDADVARLADVLSKQYGRPVHINLLVDPEVLGGIRVEIGDDVIDGTVSGRLDDARRHLVG
ncbi:F0F1 ATP synthase subunit delta [Nocardioides sp. SYSU D00038]|uniref:F0F1 ATP synthase subunit delta n=1 Tax=Nocardioides sp. SYSU D00038 TaxID=2812554 RepID=UPI0019687300|nr:F0F1 ATP synthase subunit delta [Nocardioides sp. SYSU D00038]